MMYGGDEVGAIVVDLGTGTLKVGYSGEDTPKCVIPSLVGVLDGHRHGKEGQRQNEISKSKEDVDISMGEVDSLLSSSLGQEPKSYYSGNISLGYRRDYMEITSPLSDGLIDNWDYLEYLYNHAFNDCLRVDPSDYPMLFSEPAYNTRNCREKLTELIFETYQVPAFYLSKAPVLASFAMGKATSLVMDFGQAKTSIVPVHEGFVLKEGAFFGNIGGSTLTEELYKIIQKMGKVIYPGYMISNKKHGNDPPAVITEYPNTSESYSKYRILNIVQDIKETLCRVSEGPFNVQAVIPKVSYELPDGNSVELGTERFCIPELLFNPSIIPELAAEKGNSGILDMVKSCIDKCDVDIRQSLFSSFIVTGGSSLFKGLTERVAVELSDLLTTYKGKVVAPTSISERNYGVFIGGSILSSLGSFHQLWMSKQEYEEHGRSFIEKKCS